MKSQFKRVVVCEYMTNVEYPNDEALDKYIAANGEEAILSINPPLTTRHHNSQNVLMDQNATVDLTIDADGKPIAVERSAKKPGLAAVPTEGPR